MPAGDTYDVPQLQAHVYAPRPIPRPAIVLLGAARTDAGVHIQLARPLRTPGHVELSPPEAQPDTWWRIGEIGAGGSTSITIAYATEGGSRLRVVAESADGPLLSNIVFVIDSVRATRRAGRSGDIRPTTEPFDLFRNTALAETFVADLDALRAGYFPSPRTAAATTSGGTVTADIGAHVAHGNWEDYLDRCAGRLGNSLLRFALGLPQPSGDSTAWADVVAAAWDEELPADEDFGLEGDQAEDAAASTAGAVVARIPSMADQSQHVRGRYRTWATGLAAKIAQLGPLERTLALRLIIWTVAANAWDTSDPAGLAVIAKATEALGAPPAPPTEMEPSTASLAAVAVSILRAEPPRTIRTPATLMFERVVKVVAHLLSAVDARYIDVYTQLLDDRFGAAVHPAVVEAIAAEVVQADPFADAVRALDEAGSYGAHRHGRLLHVPGPASNPTLRALGAVGFAQAAAPVGAWAGSGTKWALVVWDPPGLFVFTHDKADLWTEYRLTGTYTPRDCASEREIDPRFRIEAPFKGKPLNDAARRALAAVELDAPTPRACDC